MNLAQRSFARGEIAPALYARTDMAGYATGLRTLRNMYVQRHGGVTNRAGTRFVNECRSENRRVRLIKFVFNAEQTYVIEMGNHYARFFRAGARISSGSPDAWVTATDYIVGDTVSSGGDNYYCTVAHTSGATTEPGVGADYENFWYLQDAFTGTAYEIPTPYDEADLPEIRYVQSVDVITLTHPGYPPQELKRYGDTRWVLTGITFGPSIGPPSNLGVTGGIAGATTYWAVTAISETTGEESLPAYVDAVNAVPDPGTPSIITWDPVTGASDYNVYRSSDGRTYGRVFPSSGTGTESTDNSWTTDFENVTITGPAQTWQSATSQCRNPLGAISATDRPYNGKYTVRGKVTLAAASFTIGFTNGRGTVYYSRDGEARVLAGRFPLDFNINGSQNVTRDFEWTFAVPDNGYTAITIDVVPEIFIENAGAAHTCNIDFGSVPQNVVAWTVLNTGGGFNDLGEIPDLLQQPPKHPALFDAAGNFPTCTTFYQQRRMFGNTDAEPERVWGSGTGNYKNFASSIPLQDDDAISFSLAGRQVNAVKHLIDLGRLLMMTSGSIHFVEGDDAGILRPDSINPRQIAYNGIGTLAPLPISDAAIYVQARQSIVRDLKPLSADNYEGSDLTVFAAHLFEGYTVVDWDYAETPHSIVWVVRSDGVMLGLTYLREHAIWGWHRHDTEGVIENVCCVPEGSEDALYMVVRREREGFTQRYIERMESRFFTDQRDAFFVDSGLTYDGWNTGADTMEVTGGTTWASDELLTVTRSAGSFAASNVGDAVVLLDEDGVEYRINITEYTDPLNVNGFPSATLPVALRDTPTTEWALAVDTVTGLHHLNGHNVSVYADGFVISNPNNPAYPFSTVVLNEVTFDRPYAKIHVGLPFISDFETLDIDTPSGSSRKDRGTLINNVGLYVEKSRGIWAGPEAPTGDDPLEGLTEFKLRPAESPSTPPPLETRKVDANIGNRWNDNGRVLVRQVDPLPLTILAAIPAGFLG